MQYYLFNEDLVDRVDGDLEGMGDWLESSTGVAESGISVPCWFA